MALPADVTIVHPAGALPRQRRWYKAPRPKRMPLGIMQTYAVELRRLVAEYEGLVRELLGRQLPELEQAAEAQRPERTDAYGDVAEELLEELKTLAARVFSDIVARLLANRVGARVNDWDKKETSRQLLRSLGVDLLSAEPWLADHLDAFVRDNVRLIKSIPEQHLREVERIIYDGFRSARRVQEIRAQLMARFGGAKSRADLIARDQVLKLNAELDTLRQKSIGVTRQRWATSRDERVRERHRQVNGRVYPIDDPPAAGPGGRKVRPGEDYQCRCQGLPVLDDLLQGLEQSSNRQVSFIK